MLSGWADEQTYPVAFRLALDAPAEVVYLAGSFNQWQPRMTPMTPDADKRVWSLTLTPACGRTPIQVRGQRHGLAHRPQRARD
jgi:1,4-alpha-glucan branching enzyme